MLSAVPSKTASTERPGLPVPGEIFAGKYAIVRVIGEGGMGIVYEAVHCRLDRKVAIKTLQPAAMEHADAVARFEREGRAAAQLKDRHVARTLDVDESADGLPYMVMEHLEGIDLDVDLEQRGPFPIAESVDYILQACEAMHEAHGLGIIHRDLKPANLFICTANGGRVLKVLDFGISWMSEEKGRRLTATEATLGTPVYMSPEQVRGTRDLDHRSDIWSLGVILYELLAGEPPFGGSATAAAVAIATEPIPPVSTKRPDVPAELEAVIARALAKDAEDRFPDVASFAAALMPFAPHRTQWLSDPDLGASGFVDLQRAILSSGPDLREWSPSVERAETLSAAALRSAETLPAHGSGLRGRLRWTALALSIAMLLTVGVRASVHSTTPVNPSRVAAAPTGANEVARADLALAQAAPVNPSHEQVAEEGPPAETATSIPPPVVKRPVPTRSNPVAAAPLPKVQPRPTPSSPLDHPLYIP